MSELNDSSELQQYSQAVLYVISAVNVPPEYTVVVANHFLTAIKSSDVSIYLCILSLNLTVPTSRGASDSTHCQHSWCSSTGTS